MESQQALRPGATLRHNSYRIESVLGQGGFGITYLATDISLDKKVAIKEFFPKDYCGRESATSHVTLGTQSASDFVQRLKAKFLKEARNIAKFDHPNIIKIHAAFEENNTAYYVMDFIEGESLAERVRRSGPLAPARAVAYIASVGAALAYVHDRRINHLDVKPANIMLRSADDTPVLIDFGLSKQYDSDGQQTSTTPTGISHGYAPMEQYNDGGVREFSPQTDVYSLAATLYFLLSGVTPPQAPKLIEDELTFPAAIPQRLIAPISKAMSPGRRQRHESVDSFLVEITASAAAPADSDSTTFRNAPAPEPQPKPRTEPKAPRPSLRTDTDDSHKEKSGGINTKWLALGFVAIIATIVTISVMSGDGYDEDYDSFSDSSEVAEDIDYAQEAMPVDSIRSVTSMYYQSSLGPCSYTGEVDWNNLPSGHGKASWTSGEAKYYDGEWENGKMHGLCVYTLRNGDRFEGTFKNDKYHNGTYTIASSGDYFVGSFRGGQPAKGTWYNRNGVAYN